MGVASKRNEVESFTNGLEAAEMIPLFPHTLEQLEQMVHTKTERISGGTSVR